MRGTLSRSMKPLLGLAMRVWRTSSSCVSGLAFFMVTVMGWSIGPIEARV